MMYVYVQSEPGLWTVGFYTPDGRWISESDHESTESAARRVAWLNGAKEETCLKRRQMGSPRFFTNSRSGAGNRRNHESTARREINGKGAAIREPTNQPRDTGRLREVQILQANGRRAARTE